MGQIFFYYFSRRMQIIPCIISHSSNSNKKQSHLVKKPQSVVFIQRQKSQIRPVNKDIDQSHHLRFFNRVRRVPPKQSKDKCASNQYTSFVHLYYTPL